MEFGHTEFEIEVLCPDCGSTSVILEENSDGYFHVNRCLNCNFHTNNKFHRKTIHH